METTNKEKAREIATRVSNESKDFCLTYADIEVACFEMAEWKDEQARLQRAKTCEASKLSNRVQEMQNLLEWLYQNAPAAVYRAVEKEIREYQNIAYEKLNKELGE